jgi:hypothetical protein
LQCLDARDGERREPHRAAADEHADQNLSESAVTFHHDVMFS